MLQHQASLSDRLFRRLRQHLQQNTGATYLVISKHSLWCT